MTDALGDTAAATPMPEWARHLVASLLETYPNDVQELPTPFDIPQVQVLPQALPAVAAWLKERGFNLLQDVGGVDYLPREPRFEVVYHLLSVANLQRVRLRVPVGAEHPEVPTLAHLWPSAEPAEREVYDLFGIVFTGHPNLTRILLPADWEGHPLRKDYPLRGPREAQVRFTANKGRFHAPRTLRQQQES